jgi:ATP-dependent DNA helicase RecQ
VSDAALTAAQAHIGKPGVEIPAKKLWPTGMASLGVPMTGKIKQVAETGRALGRLSDVGWGTKLRALFEAPDAPVPDDVFKAVVDVLATWGWAQRPSAVVAVPSRTRPLLVESLAARIAAVGKLTALGTLTRVGTSAPSTGRSNSAQRLKAVHGSLSAQGLALDGAAVLLVDDRTDTGWTLTEATRVLRDAGAGPVLPLVLAIDG